MNRPVRALKWVVGALLVVGVVSSAGIYAYIKVFKEDAPPPLSFDQRDKQSGAPQCESPENKTFESGFVDFDLTDSDQNVVGSTSVMSGEVQVCGDLIVGGTIDVDAASLVSGTEKAEELQAYFQADEFPIVTLAVGSNGLATAAFAGTEKTVSFVGDFRDGKPNISVKITAP
jgi:hypothetical protein